MADMSLLKQQRKIIKTAFTRFHNYCSSSDATIEEVRARVERAESLFTKYESIQDEIDANVHEREEAAENEYRCYMENVFLSIKSTYYRLMSNNAVTEQIAAHQAQNNTSGDIATAVQALVEHQSSMSVLIERFVNNVRVDNTSTPNESHRPPQTELKLPTIQLPDFDGNLLDWTRFKDLFEALVHVRTNLSPVEKLEYLHTKLKGEALLVIKHLKPNNTNYDTAWELLKKKYDNIENIKSSFLELILDQPAMKSSSLMEVKRIFNNSNEGFNALKALDEGVIQWSTVLLFNVEKKLDSSTASAWYKEKSNIGNATFQIFLDFLGRRIVELESAQKHNNHGTTDKTFNRNQLRTHAAIVQSCPTCSQKHLLYQCDKFKAMTIENRRTVVNKNNMCFNCLQPNHRAVDCKRSVCKKCGKKHNTLLHLDMVQDRANMQDNNSSLSTSNQVVGSSIASTNTIKHRFCILSF